MNLNLPGVILLAMGVVFIFAARENQDPRDIVLAALGQRMRYGKLAEDKGVGKAGGFAKPAQVAPTQPVTPPGTIWVSV